MKKNAFMDGHENEQLATIEKKSQECDIVSHMKIFKLTRSEKPIFQSIFCPCTQRETEWPQL